ncbi:MAG: lipocalin family protein [Candidatus Melainabacteria bacterium]|jgi:apolipoprotein D and lipocalin family protein
MKKIVLFFAALLLFISNTSFAKPPETMLKVDLTKYIGTWYEIARYENWFERDCSGTQAKYELINENQISVTNICQLKDNSSKIKIAQGKGYIDDKVSNAKLKVVFPAFLPAIFGGDYWILYVDSEYQTALIGDSQRKYFWILSRNKTISADSYEKLILIATEKGFVSKKIIKTPVWKN